MAKTRTSQMIHGDGVTLEAYFNGQGPTLVILPSYGRDGGDDYDDISSRLAEDGWKVVRPQPRGVAGSTAPMQNLSLHDLAADVALCIRELANGPAVLIGHAFGNVLARVVTTDHPDLVKAVVLAAAEASKVPEDIRKAPFIAGDLSAPESERLAALRKAFFAPNHDASVWLTGWYPATLKMEQAAVRKTALRTIRACGRAPLLQVIGEYDPFNPHPYWNELRNEFGDRVTVSVVKDASHALFPEQPGLVADAILPWVAHYKG